MKTGVILDTRRARRKNNYDVINNSDLDGPL